MYYSMFSSAKQIDFVILCEKMLILSNPIADTTLRKIVKICKINVYVETDVRILIFFFQSLKM